MTRWYLFCTHPSPGQLLPYSDFLRTPLSLGWCTCVHICMQGCLGTALWLMLLCLIFSVTPYLHYMSLSHLSFTGKLSEYISIVGLSFSSFTLSLQGTVHHFFSTASLKLLSTRSPVASMSLKLMNTFQWLSYFTFQHYFIALTFSDISRNSTLLVCLLPPSPVVFPCLLQRLLFFSNIFKYSSSSGFWLFVLNLLSQGDPSIAIYMLMILESFYPVQTFLLTAKHECPNYWTSLLNGLLGASTSQGLQLNFLCPPVNRTATYPVA